MMNMNNFYILFQVNHTAIEQNDEVFDDECPESNNGNSSAVSKWSYRIN